MTIAEKLTQIAENEQKVYDAGKKAESERFWSAYTNRYTWATCGVFYGGVWDFDSFYPACDIRPVGDASHLFYAWEGQMGKNHSGSLKKRFEECGVVLDTSQATKLTRAFSYSYITEIPTVDCTNLGNSTTHVFAVTPGPYVDIEKLIVNEQLTYVDWFNSSKVRNISFEGVIGQNIDFRHSKLLSKASIESIITHLSDTASGKTLTLSKKAVESAFASPAYIAEPLHPFTLDVAALTANGYNVTDNGDGSLTVNGGTEASSGYIEFINGPLPAGVYEVSYSEEGDGIAWGLSVAVDGQGFPVVNGQAVQITINDGDTLILGVDLMGEYRGRKMTPTLKRAYTWDELVATKPNWTITLV